VLKKTPAQLDAEIAEALTSPRSRARAVRFTVPTVGPRGQVADPAPGFVRLYRGGGGGLSDVTSTTHGQWFTTRLSSARDYVGADVDGPLPPGTVILCVDVHGADVAGMPQTLIQASGYTPTPISADDQEWLRSPKHLKEWGPPDVEVQVPVSVARAATRLLGSTRAVSRSKPTRGR
jgi:hypothetical protein